ncbi:MAG: tetratricopeptide repeat protein [Bacteroidales bacterium]|nr:tetratricopeptide repeat protein [Bacteroidales bacterium]MCF8388713.1 tetratricopeptide repeat protein [Bacteroidales bacterium]MCF8399515.1 tetratricopeptide repeat protein [Bacteroidales bacterium]
MSLSASLIIASHPIQVMAVSYISQRATLLVSLFYILSVYFYMQARKMQISQSPKSIVIFLYFLTAFSGFLALLSKQNAISLLIMLWFVEFFFFRSKNKCFSHKLLSVWGAILIFGFVIITIAGYLPRESENITRWQYLFSQFKVYLQYFQLIIYPSGFNIDHGIELSNSIWGVYELSGLLLILLLLFIAAYLYNKKNAIISFGIIWFFVSMLVESSIIPITDLMFEHRLYLPLVGLVLSLSATLFFILKQNIRIFGLLIMAIVILLGFITYERNNDWKNNKTIWQSSLEENPDNKRALVYVGNAYMHSKPDKALKYYNRALQIDSAYYFAWMNRGMIYYNKKDFSKAASSFDQALKMPGRKHPVLYLKKGISELQLDKLKVSLHDFNRYIAAVPGNAEAYIYRGQVHYYLGDYMESAQDFKTAVSLDPSRSNLYLNIIETYYRAKRPDLVEKYVTIARKNHLKVKQHYLNYVDSQ